MVSGEAARTCLPGKPHTWAEYITETHCRNMIECFPQEYWMVEQTPCGLLVVHLALRFRVPPADAIYLELVECIG